MAPFSAAPLFYWKQNYLDRGYILAAILFLGGLFNFSRELHLHHYGACLAFLGMAAGGVLAFLLISMFPP